MSQRFMKAWTLPATLLLAATTVAQAQEQPLVWGASKYFRYNIESVSVSGPAVKVVFSVVNPLTGLAWDIKAADPFKGGSSSSLRVLVSWSSDEFTNTGSVGGSLNPVITTTAGTSAAAPITINALTTAQRCTGAVDCPGVADVTNRFWVTTNAFPLAFPSGHVTSGMAAIEGHPACATSIPECPAPTVVGGVATLAFVPVKAAIREFPFNGGTPVARRKIVEFNKCQNCHNGGTREGVTIPRLSLHGGNRTEEPGLCVACHNPNQTDIAYRTSGAETPIDFKTMIHSIHGEKRRETPYIVIGFRGSVNDYSHVEFPGNVRNCATCHIDVNGKGTFELPISAKALGTTVRTGSVAAPAGGTRTIDVDPFNDAKITPTAAVCSGCHDSSKARSHMTRTGGASFSTLQQNIIAGVTERCATCHGPGKDKSVRKVHR